MSGFPGHQKGQRILDSGIISDVDQALIDDFGSRLGRYVGA